MGDSLKVLICGGGCAGPALAFWLARTGHKVVVVERYPALRASGAQVDLRGEGVEAIRRMGLLDAVRQKLVDEPGVSFVDEQGRTRAAILVNRSGTGAQSLTSEYEIMRGDLVRILYDATKDNVQYIFGVTVERFEQDEEKVIAYFSDGTCDSFDLLVGADGQGSRVRQQILPHGAPDPYWRLGIDMAYWFIPRSDSDTNLRNTYLARKGRMIMRRSHNPVETQVYFVLRDSTQALARIPRGSVSEQKKFFARMFDDAGWQTERFIRGMEQSENFYCQEVVQIRTANWYSNRVVLLGDAAWCPSPFSGMGTTSGLVGAYVLAAQINRHLHNLTEAFAEYDRTLRPFINEIQNVHPLLLRAAIPWTRWGVEVILSLGSLFSALRIPDLVARLSRKEKGGWQLPRYAELPMDGEAKD